MRRTSNTSKNKCKYKRCKWPRMPYKKYCEKHADKLNEATPLMKTISQVMDEQRKASSYQSLQRQLSHVAPSFEVMPENPPSKEDKKLAKRIMKFIFK